MVVTGASPGSIGWATARTLANWGARVSITARRDVASTVSALNAVVAPSAAGGIDGHELDLCEAASVARFSEWVAATHDGRLDVLVNNAGVHLDLRSQWKVPRLTPDGREIHWRTNYLGTMDLTHRLLPRLLATARETGDARIVNVVSMLHARGRNDALFAPLSPYDSWTAYGTSKLALVHATRELERRYSAAGVHAVSLHPGAVYTRIADKGLEGSRAIEAIRRVLVPVEAFLLLTIDEGAQTSLHCATARNLAGGAYYRNVAPAMASAESNDSAVSARLWEATLAELRAG